MAKKKPSKSIDFFICHASEDKDEIARPLADALTARGFRVWYDEVSLNLGDSLRQSIDHGIAACRFGVVILSKSFFAKSWPQRELNGLVNREIDRKDKLILPVWHGVSEEYVRAYSPPLADRIAVPSSRGVDFIVENILKGIRHDAGPTTEWRGRELPTHPNTINCHMSRGIGRRAFEALIYYEFRDHENIDFDDVARSVRSGDCRLGLDEKDERIIVQHLTSIAISHELTEPHDVLDAHLECETRSWVWGVFNQWKYRFPNTERSRRKTEMSFSIDIRERRSEFLFFGGDDNVTESQFRSKRFQRLDRQIKNVLPIVLPICVPNSKGAIEVERWFVSESENEKLGEEGIELAPAIVYTW